MAALPHFGVLRMPPKRQRASIAKPPACSIDLPESVWMHISSFMSLKDWARACGTNQTTFKLQLRTVTVPPDLAQAGLEWVSKRLSLHSIELAAVNFWTAL
ncbi:hypothetical protein WJX75_007342 [Coccomyxa subellipsoidea]|uniref:F-box domain-containing protein n=1 Tax=Coccomyxa subellipsoidea TaxID=248742 RepID=A0ABR2YI65_9CHLO